MNHIAKAPVHFNRQEINAIMALYGRMVAAGEWRDYAIDSLRDRAIFSIFRHASEMPLYRVEKIPALLHRQGQYQVLAPGNQILKRGKDLRAVLKVFDTRRFHVV
ncbi:MAG: hypothetical protein COA85_13500 [Robiginitomaculum sp.]|nr:MAG: hypothetical protein COA85_13500 [Robiginitomaculum sp.]